MNEKFLERSKARLTEKNQRVMQKVGKLNILISPAELNKVYQNSIRKTWNIYDIQSLHPQSTSIPIQKFCFCLVWIHKQTFVTFSTKFRVPYKSMDRPNIKHVPPAEGEVLFGPRTALHRDTKFMSTFFFALQANTIFFISVLRLFYQKLLWVPELLLSRINLRPEQNINLCFLDIRHAKKDE